MIPSPGVTSHIVQLGSLTGSLGTPLHSHPTPVEMTLVPMRKIGAMSGSAFQPPSHPPTVWQLTTNKMVWFKIDSCSIECFYLELD